MEPIRILIVDDHTIVRQGLGKILEAEKDIEVIGEAKNGFEAIEKAKALVPDILLMDIDMPKLDGIESTRAIRRETPHTQIIILTVHKDDEHLFESIKAGADGYLTKDIDSKELIKTIKAVSNGEALLSPSIAVKILNEFRRISEEKKEAEAENLFLLLTDREQEVLAQITKGKSNKEIADILCISEKTVKSHITNIFQKIHVNDRTQAVIYAFQKGVMNNKTIRS